MKKILCLMIGVLLALGVSQAQAGNFWDELADSMKSGNLPPGNYQESCRHCVMESGMLNCKCRNQRGEEGYTRLYVNRECRYIENRNGVLTCTGWERERERDYYPPRHHRRPNYPSYPRESVRVLLEAGPIWSDSDADRKCPRVCDRENMYWTGHWKTTVQGEMSVCQCTR
jgi:hypothetical protein